MTNLPSAGDEPAATDLDSIITHALAERGNGDAATAAGAESFTAATASDASASEPADAAPSGEPSPAAEIASLMQPLEPPARWTPDKKASFAAWPRDVQEAVAARNAELEADYTRKTQEAAELRRTAEPYLNAIKPYEAYLNELAPIIGQTPDTMIASLLGAEYQLRTGDPHEKAQALRAIAASYGIDLALSREELPAAQATPDPHYQQLRQSFGTLEQRVAQTEQMIEAEQQRQTAQEIEAFANARDAAGRLRHPYFPRVRGVMAQLFRDDPALTLPAAYQKATEPLQQAIAEELRIHQDMAERRRREAVEKARKVAPVKSSGSSPNGSAKAKDLDALLWDNINAKIA
jgi:hypothetical protein